MDLTIPGWYLPARSALWGLAGTAAAVGLFLGRRWSLHFTRWSTAVYFVWYGADRLLLRTSSFARQALWFYGTLELLACLLVLWVLSRASTRAFFEEYVG